MLIHLMVEGEGVGDARKLRFFQNLVIEARTPDEALKHARSYLAETHAVFISHDPAETYESVEENVGYPRVEHSAVKFATGRIWVDLDLRPGKRLWRALCFWRKE